ncbi:MAG: hypothetical protein Fur0010_12290 [Bdellovibrio sp.]
MIDQIVCALPKGREVEIIQIFGYTSRGIPGLEIVGLGQQGRAIKEKIVYINKKLNLDIPNRRYLICIENELIDTLSKSERRFLELPVWLLYLKLSGNIPIHGLRDVLSGGRLQIQGGIDCLNFKEDQIKSFNCKGLIPVVKKADFDQKVIELPEIISHLRAKRAIGTANP